MASAITSIRIAGLSRLDQLELGDESAAGAIRFEGETLPGGQHGELLSTGVVMITLAGLQVLAAYLLKNRRQNRIQKKIEIVHADGSRRYETIDIDLSSSDAPSDTVLTALAKLVGANISTLRGK